MPDADAVRRTIGGAGGLPLAADDAGPHDRPAVVLLHGGGQTRHSWSAAMTALVACGYRVINYDARGHGDSGWSPEGAYQLDDRAADLRAIVADLDRPFALVGASLGGATAIHAAAHGLTPAAMVLVDIVPEAEKAGVDRILAFMRAHGSGFASLDEASDAVADYNPDRPRPRDATGLLRNLRRRDDGRFYWHWDPRITVGEPDRHHAVVRASAAALAARPALPVLLVRGLRSDVVSDEGVAAFTRLLPHLETVDVADAGHMVAGDRNDAFNAATIDFLQRHLPITS